MIAVARRGLLPAARPADYTNFPAAAQGEKGVFFANSFTYDHHHDIGLYFSCEIFYYTAIGREHPLPDQKISRRTLP